MKSQTGMTIIVKTITRIILWMILLYGIYIILHGHLTPGGGFGGGVIIALAFLSIMLAYGRAYTAEWLNIKFLQEFEASSILLFLIVGIMGFGFGGAFLLNFLSHGTLFHLVSAGTIPLLNIFIGIKVGVSLFLVVWALAELHIEKGDKA
ncbi:MAG: MnhB domain-containing protein [Calditrichaceae bacterium]|jgi:multisubunit Na+/H+ antiporter MnhB subunit